MAVRPVETILCSRRAGGIACIGYRIATWSARERVLDPRHPVANTIYFALSATAWERCSGVVSHFLSGEVGGSSISDLPGGARAAFEMKFTRQFSDRQGRQPLRAAAGWGRLTAATVEPEGHRILRRASASVHRSQRRLSSATICPGVHQYCHRECSAAELRPGRGKSSGRRAVARYARWTNHVSGIPLIGAGTGLAGLRGS